MREFRNHLADLRRAYRSPRYPGDLGTIIKPVRIARGKYIWTSAASVAVLAGAIFLASRHSQPSQQNSPVNTVAASHATPEKETSPHGTCEKRNTVDFTPNVPGFILSVPSMSFEADADRDLPVPTTQETVI